MYIYMETQVSKAYSKGRHYFRLVQGYVGNMERMWYTQQVASGLAYLASLNIVHRDIAARNILLDSPNAYSHGFYMPKVSGNLVLPCLRMDCLCAYLSIR